MQVFDTNIHLVVYHIRIARHGFWKVCFIRSKIFRGKFNVLLVLKKMC